jgi:hypothetical protein
MTGFSPSGQETPLAQKLGVFSGSVLTDSMAHNCILTANRLAKLITFEESR